jgi:excisionase family DNA binding protein
VNNRERRLELPVPADLIEAIAERVADIVVDRLADQPRGSGSSVWMRSGEAAQYLGWSRSAVYDRVARKAMPHYKVDGMLLFRRNELDAWLEQYREDPMGPDTLDAPAAVGRRRTRTAPVARQATTADVGKHELPKKSKPRRPRPLPPPLSGDDEHKDEWARQLEVTRAQLDEMSPSHFRKAWDERNKRRRRWRVRALDGTH